MKEIQVIGAKLKGAIFCHYGLRVDIGKNRHDTIPTIKSERPIHDDLRNAFLALTVHLPVILGDLKPGDIEDINSNVNNFKGSEETRALLAKFTVLEVNLDPELGCVELIGTKILDLGIMGITTPNVLFSGGYYYALELQYAVETLFKEVELYREGKQAPEIVDTDMFNDKPDGGVTVKEEPKKKKVRGEKKKKAKRTGGYFTDLTGHYPESDGVDIVMEEDAEPGDIIGTNMDGSPKFMPKDPNLGDATSEPLSNFQRDPKEVTD